jgi:ribokinase
MITVFGSLNVDLVTRVARIPRPGETVTGSDYRLIPGGKGANQALAARRASGRVALYGAIGYDGFADTALTELKPAGIDLLGVARVPHPTGLAVISVDEKGENVIVITPGANAHAKAEKIPAEAFARGSILLVQMEVPFAETLAAARMAKAAGARTILSLAPYTPLTADDIAAFDVIVVNQHEAADLAKHLGVSAEGAEATVAGLAARLGRTVIATLGGDGAVAVHEGGTIRVPALTVTPVDTTGAGDTFSGVLAAYLDAGADMATALAKAAVAGSLACTKAGAQPSFPTRAEIETASAR